MPALLPQDLQFSCGNHLHKIRFPSLLPLASLLLCRSRILLPTQVLLLLSIAAVCTAAPGLKQRVNARNSRKKGSWRTEIMKAKSQRRRLMDFVDPPDSALPPANGGGGQEPGACSKGGCCGAGTTWQDGKCRAEYNKCAEDCEEDGALTCVTFSQECPGDAGPAVGTDPDWSGCSTGGDDCSFTNHVDRYAAQVVYAAQLRTRQIAHGERLHMYATVGVSLFGSGSPSFTPQLSRTPIGGGDADLSATCTDQASRGVGTENKS